MTPALPPMQLLARWLQARLTTEAVAWLNPVLNAATERGADAKFHLAFSAVSRRVGKQRLALEAEEIRAAQEARRGWQPGWWRVDHAARAAMLIALSNAESTSYVSDVESMFSDADLAELVALYQALPLLPQPAAWCQRAAEGVRSNMQVVFEAIAIRNPYPAEQLDEGAFNQLVLKCLFIGSPLHAVWNLDGRGNPALAGMLCDYARERWAAKRSVPWELWRGVGRHASGDMLEVLARVLETGSEMEQLSVALAARDNPLASPILKSNKPLMERVTSSDVSWEQLASMAR